MVRVYKGDKLLKMDQGTGGERSNSNPRGKLPLVSRVDANGTTLFLKNTLNDVKFID